MAKIDKTGLDPMRLGKLEQLLGKLMRFDTGVMTLGAWIESLPADTDKEVTDGQIDYSRTRFNRMDYHEQDAYMARLKAKRLYWINSVLVPKTVWLRVEGVVTQDVDRAAA